MASDPRASRLTEAHRLAQARLGAQTVQQMLTVWPLLDADDLDGSTQRWLRAVVPIVQRQRSVSARLAGNYMSTFRALELGQVSPFVPTLVEAEPVEAIMQSLTVTGPVAVKAHMRSSPVVDRAMEIGRTMSSGSAMRHAMNGGRQTITESVRNDQRAIGWARATSGKPCAFCAMVASRGPVYREESTGDFQAHDHCSCGVEPVYRTDAAWPAGSRRYQDLWNEATAGASSTDEARIAFRQALSAA